MIHLVKGVKKFEAQPVRKLWDKDDDQVLAYMRGNLVFVYNFNPSKSFTDYGILAPEGEYVGVMNSDDPRYGGYGNIDNTVHHFTEHDELYAENGVGWLKLYIPARSAMVLKLAPKPRKKAAPKAEKPVKTAKKATAKAEKPATAKKTAAKKTKKEE